MEESDLDGIPLPSQRSSGTGQKRRRRPARRPSTQLSAALDLDLDDLGLSSEVEIQSEKFEHESFETSIVKFLEESLENLRLDFLHHFERVVESAFSFEEIVDSFSSALTKRIAEVIGDSESESTLSLKDLNRNAAEQFEILSLPRHEVGEEKQKRISSADIEAATRKFAESAGKTLETLTLERSDLAAARDMESYRAISASRSGSLLGDLEALERQLDIQGSVIEKQMAKLEREQEQFRKSELKMLGDFDVGVSSVSIKKLLVDLPREISQSRVAGTRKKAEKFVTYVDDLMTGITTMATRIQISGDQICRVANGVLNQRKAEMPQGMVMDPAQSPRPLKMQYPRPLEIDHDGLLGEVRARLDHIQRERQEASKVIAQLK